MTYFKSLFSWNKILILLTCLRPYLFCTMENSPRTAGGQFSSVCKNKFHNEWREISLKTYPDDNQEFQLKRPKFAEIQQLESISGVKLRRGAKICEMCINHLHELNPWIGSFDAGKSLDHNYVSSHKPNLKRKNDDSEQPTDTSMPLKKDDFLTEEFLNTLESSELEKLAFLLGKIAGCNITTSSHEGLYKNNNFLQNLDLSAYLKTFDNTICKFLDGLKSSKRANSQDDYNKVKVHEHILHMLFPSIVLPLCFMENLLLYNKTSSRQATDLIGNGGPHGCYDVVKDWLGNQSMNQLQFPCGDCVVVFDNNQVIGRSWKVKLNNKVKSSVVTTICQIEYPGYGNIQSRNDLLPKFWHLDIIKLHNNVKEVPESVSNFHYRLLYTSIAEHLKVVVSEYQLTANGLTDKIDAEVSRQLTAEKSKSCHKCGYSNSKNKRICGNDLCRANLKQAEMDSLGVDELGTFTLRNKSENKQFSEVRLEFKCDQDGSYIIHKQTDCGDTSTLVNHLEMGHRDTPPKLSLSDPSFVNPNSFDSVRTVLRQIGLNAGIKIYKDGGTREWLFVVCDGLPYGLCQHVINTTYRCKNCDVATDSYTSKEQFLAHHELVHSNDEPDEFLEFSWVILRPGNGHFEMNMFKSFVELNWEVFFSDLCILMGFKSENAQRTAKSCSDNHKTWSLIRIAYEGLMQELMVPYIQHCVHDNTKITPKGFLHYVLVEAKDPNYLYVATMTLTYLQAIINMRAGLRCGNVEAIASAKAVFAPLFHSRNHPRYQEIEMQEAIQRHSIPQDLLNFFNETESVCLSGDKTSGEGLDFKAEAVNKDVQSWMPRGVPTGEDWLRVTRNLENLKMLREKAKQLTSSATSHRQSASRTTTHDEQIFGWRVYLRRKEYLSHPLETNRKHVSLSSQELDSDLINFNVLAEKRRQQYFNSKVNTNLSEETTLPPVFVTKKERQEYDLISNKTKSEIYDIIDGKINKLLDQDLKTSMSTEFRKLGSISKCKKDDLVRFHDILEDIHHQQDCGIDDICLD